MRQLFAWPSVVGLLVALMIIGAPQPASADHGQQHWVAVPSWSGVGVFGEEPWVVTGRTAELDITECTSFNLGGRFVFRSASYAIPIRVSRSVTANLRGIDKVHWDLETPPAPGTVVETVPGAWGGCVVNGTLYALRGVVLTSRR